MPTPPPGLWSDLQQDLPVALVPVRLETKYGTREETLPDASVVTIPVLRVRIYPDDISVATSGPGLTTVDKEAGADFWAVQVAPETDAEVAVPGALEHRRRAAWEVLARRVGPTRTAYVANATRPGADPVPDSDQQAATAALLPDSWVVVGTLDGQQVLVEHVTRAAADLQVGPSRQQGRDAFDPDDPHLLHPDDGLRWATDFDAAVAIGMATVIDLATVQEVQAGARSPVATRGLDSLVVVGVRPPDGADRTPDKEAEAFAGLLAAHARTDKVAFVAQGTPTNNLTDQPSGWTSTGDVYAGYDQVVDPRAAPAPISEVSALRGGAPDGTTFEAALGLPTGVTAGWDGASRHEQWLARNMALALFPATIGEVVGTLGRPGSLNGIINQTAVDRYLDQLDTVMPFVREHVGAFVRGRGPVPTLRIGRQPYGVLPILPSSRWNRVDAEPEQLTRLHDVLGVARSFFEPAAAKVPRLRSAADTTTEMVRILGLSPVPHAGAYAVRDVVGRAASIIFMMDKEPPVAPGANASNAELVRSIAATGLLDAQITLPAYRYLMSLTLGDLIHGTEMEWLALNGVKPMRVPVARTDPNRRGWESPSTYLSRLCHDVIDLLLLVQRQQDPRPHDLLFLLAEHALALAGELDSIRILGAANLELFSQAVSVPTEVAATQLPAAHAFATAMTSPVTEIFGAGVAQQLPAETITSQVFDDAKRAALLGALNLPHEHVNGFAGTRDALRALADAELSDADYTRLTSETLACASTRLDAWYTSLAAQRLEQQRSVRPTGLQVGAWGILTDVRPRPAAAAEAPVGWDDSAGSSVTSLPLVSPPQQVGYVHAPSLAQARTAGVLRAGELAHAGDDSSLASLDLTSRRVRLGREVLDALGNGQPLGAVLGYRLERMLADRTLYAEIAALRVAFPQRRTQGDPGTVAAGSDLVVPREVVDGYEVWQHQAQALATCPDADHRPAVQEVITQLDQVVESVADLLVAEGVHQITTGRPESAGATFTAAANGTPPPDVDVVREPRSGVTLTHRTVAVLDPDGGTAGWTRKAPRAVLAPAAERWAEDVLGEAGDWQVSVGGRQVGLDDLDVCALDVLVEARAGAADVPPLHDRFIAAQDDPLATIEDEAFVRLLALAQAAGEVLGRARPALSADLVPPAEASSTDAGTVLAVARPAASELTPTAKRIAAAVQELVEAITAVATAAEDLDPDTLAEATLDGDLMVPFRDLGLPGSMRRGAHVSARDALAVASAGATVLRDIDQLITQGLPQPPPVDATTRAAQLEAVCAAPQAVDSLVAIIRRLGGQAVVPTFEVDSRLGECAVPDVDDLAVESWLARMGRVRTNLAAYDDLRLFLETDGRDLESLQAFQLPLVASEGWLADELQTSDSVNTLRSWTRPSGPRAHVVAAGRPGLVTAARATALVLDEVSEVLPAPTVTTGVAAYFDAPSARPPQSILLAVHPDPAQPWSWQLLADTASEALALAKLRAVELDDLAGSGIDEFLPLTYVRDGLPRTTSLSELTKGLSFTLEAMAATRFLEVNR